MLDFFASIGDFLINIVSFVISFFRNVVEVCTLVFKGVGYAYEVLAHIPLEYQLVMIAFVSYCVIKTIIHFGG